MLSFSSSFLKSAFKYLMVPKSRIILKSLSYTNAFECDLFLSVNV